MSTNEIIRKFRYFTIADHEQEEIFLREQHQNGWELVRFSLPGFYYFKKCEPRDVIYRLDYANLNGKEKLDYLRLFEDYGWEYLGDMAGWCYFRKESVSDEDENIFSDRESRLALLDKVFKTRLLPILLIFFFCTIPGFLSSVRMGISIYFVFWLLLFILYSTIVLRCGFGLLRLKKKYETSSM